MFTGQHSSREQTRATEGKKWQQRTVCVTVCLGDEQSDGVWGRETSKSISVTLACYNQRLDEVGGRRIWGRGGPPQRQYRHWTHSYWCLP